MYILNIILNFKILPYTVESEQEFIVTRRGSTMSVVWDTYKHDMSIKSEVLICNPRHLTDGSQVYRQTSVILDDYVVNLIELYTVIASK